MPSKPITVDVHEHLVLLLVACWNFKGILCADGDRCDLATGGDRHGQEWSVVNLQGEGEVPNEFEGSSKGCEVLKYRNNRKTETRPVTYQVVLGYFGSLSHLSCSVAHVSKRALG
jgi:hypothetical protein